jgi:hypothetical protein
MVFCWLPCNSAAECPKIVGKITVSSVCNWTVLILDECKFRSWWTVQPEMLYTTEWQAQCPQVRFSHSVCLWWHKLHCLPQHLVLVTEPVSQNFCVKLKLMLSNRTKAIIPEIYFWNTPSTTNIWHIMDHCSMTTTWHENSYPSCTVVPLSLR